MLYSSVPYGAETPARMQARARGLVTGLLALWLCAGLLIYLPHNGGAGLALPFNLLTWTVICLCSAVSCLTPLPGPPGARRGERLLLAGASLWSLPLLWSPSREAGLAALPHVLALWGLILFFLLLKRLPLRGGRRAAWLWLIAVAALMQALLGGAQVLLFTGNSDAAFHGLLVTGPRPVGIFQQPNVLASLMATGVVCLLWLAVMPRLATGAGQGRGGLRHAALFILTLMLTLTGSRAGWLGALSGTLVLAAVTRRRYGHFRPLAVPLVVALAGVLIALAWQHLPGLHGDLFPVIDKTGSDSARWAILRTTWQLIHMHPLTGVGYGGFEGAFARQQMQISDGHYPGAIYHPHNELLYAWAEGGLPALAGLLLMVAGSLVMLWQPGGWRGAGVALLLPVALHVNLEYPLYQSVVHGLVLVMLLHVASGYPEALPDGARRRRSLANLPGPALLSLCLAAVMVAGLQTQQALTRIERAGLLSLATNETAAVEGVWAPWTQRERLDFDRHVALLVRYNLIRDPQLLVTFDTWATRYFLRRPDKNILLSQLMIARGLHTGRAPQLCSLGSRLWPDDPRFVCDEHDERKQPAVSFPVQAPARSGHPAPRYTHDTPEH
ncbi:Wzy polymerase domain-containing protein [Jejubacter sp. L23]|uniref:PglL family O-oligosaccharyltransferase n=1 Tax=Jejubacter sp. L23 TaxID=3092086 RepID=UPI003D7663E5